MSSGNGERVGSGVADAVGDGVGDAVDAMRAVDSGISGSSAGVELATKIAKQNSTPATTKARRNKRRVRFMNFDLAAISRYVNHYAIK
jgi:hypothetical protein